MNDKSPTIGTFATVLEAQKRLREISGDTRFTHEDREAIAKRISELRKIEKIKEARKGTSKLAKTNTNKKEKYIAETKGGIEKRFKGGLMVKPKAAKRGY